MPAPAPAPRSEPPVDARADPPALRRQPPPHLGHAYRNVFVETAALEVVITVPAVETTTTTAAVEAARPVVLPVPGELGRAPSRRAGGLSQPPRTSPPPLVEAAPERRSVTLSRRSLAVLVSFAGLGAVALAVVATAAVVGALLLTGTLHR